MTLQAETDCRLQIGHAQIDGEHRRLYELADRIGALLTSGDAAAIGRAHANILELLSYAERHFANEEALMAITDYPYLDTHRMLHRHLLSEIRDMELRALSGAPYLPVELNHYIKKWRTSHIETNDRMFGDFLATRQTHCAELAGA